MKRLVMVSKQYCILKYLLQKKMRLSVRRFCILIFMIRIIRNWKNIPKLFILLNMTFSLYPITQ